MYRAILDKSTQLYQSSGFVLSELVAVAWEDLISEKLHVFLRSRPETKRDQAAELLSTISPLLEDQEGQELIIKFVRERLLPESGLAKTWTMIDSLMSLGNIVGQIEHHLQSQSPLMSGFLSLPVPNPEIISAYRESLLLVRQISDYVLLHGGVRDETHNQGATNVAEYEEAYRSRELEEISLAAIRSLDCLLNGHDVALFRTREVRKFIEAYADLLRLS